MKKLISFVFLAVVLWGCSGDGPNYTTYTMTFENVPAAACAVDEYGSNAYDGYVGQYKSYSDAITGLTWGVNESGGVYNLYNGGVIVSNFTDHTDYGYENYLNQCSVQWGTDGGNSNGGNNNSKYFALLYGSLSPVLDTRPSIGLSDQTRPVEFESVYICNSVYTTYSMKDGDGWALALEPTDGWCKVVITGYNGAAVTNTVEYYLADFRTASSPGIVSGWHKVDLTPLGTNVTKLVFEVQGSEFDPAYGLKTPGYFCIDDLTFVRETAE